MMTEYEHLPQELRPPVLVRQTGVQHDTSYVLSQSLTYAMNICDEDEYASSDEYDNNDEQEEETFENIYKNHCQIVSDNNFETTTKNDYFEVKVEKEKENDDDENEYTCDEYEYAYEENDDDVYTL